MHSTRSRERDNPTLYKFPIRNMVWNGTLHLPDAFYELYDTIRGKLVKGVPSELIDKGNEIVKVELVETTPEQMEWFRKLIRYNDTLKVGDSRFENLLQLLEDHYQSGLEFIEPEPPKEAQHEPAMKTLIIKATSEDHHKGDEYSHDKSYPVRNITWDLNRKLPDREAYEVYIISRRERFV